MTGITACSLFDDLGLYTLRKRNDRLKDIKMITSSFVDKSDNEKLHLFNVVGTISILLLHPMGTLDKSHHCRLIPMALVLEICIQSDTGIHIVSRALSICQLVISACNTNVSMKKKLGTC